MRRSAAIRSVAGSIAGSLFLVAGLCAFPSTAAAQQPMRITMDMRDGGGSGPTVTTRSIEKYAALLGFSEEQKESALAIHEGYAAAMKDVQKARRAAVEDISRSAQDSGDHGVFMEKMPGIEKEAKEKSDRLEKSLFDDLKSLCGGAAQEEKWPRVERMRRREVELRRGTLAGESIDLVDIVGGLKLAAAAMGLLAPSLEEYETDLDAQLKARQKALADAPGFEPGKPFDVEKMQEAMAKTREAGAKVKEVNDRFARKLEALLPEDRRAEFHAAVRQAAFPMVYRASRVARDLDKALALSDLSPAQRETLGSLKSSYARDLGPANDAWAAAIEESEKTGTGAGTFAAAGGGIMTMRLNDDAPKLAEARKARRDLDDKARDKMKATLNEAQQAAVKPQPGEEEQGMEVNGGLMIRSTR